LDRINTIYRIAEEGREAHTESRSTRRGMGQKLRVEIEDGVIGEDDGRN